MKRALAALIAVSLLGCFEEELTLELQPNGQGSLRLERTASAALSRTVTDETRYAALVLADWRGVVAWSDIVAERRGGRIHVAATGWFRDANLLRRTTPRDGLRVSVVRGPGLLNVAVLEEPGVTGERLDELSEMAARDPTAGGNPIPVGAAEMKEMFVAAIEGRLP